MTLKISDVLTVPAPREQVWAFLLDFDRSARCMPGVVEFEMASDRSFRGTLEVRVGPIAARFQGQGRIEEESPPRLIRVSGSGRDQRTRTTVQASFTSTLEPIETGTRLGYEMDLTLRGRLAQFGQGIVEQTAQELSHEFLACLEAELSKAGGSEPPRPARSLLRVVLDALLAWLRARPRG